MGSSPLEGGIGRAPVACDEEALCLEERLGEVEARPPRVCAIKK